MAIGDMRGAYFSLAKMDLSILDLNLDGGATSVAIINSVTFASTLSRSRYGLISFVEVIFTVFFNVHSANSLRVQAHICYRSAILPNVLALFFHDLCHAEQLTAEANHQHCVADDFWRHSLGIEHSLWEAGYHLVRQKHDANFLHFFLVELVVHQALN